MIMFDWTSITGTTTTGFVGCGVVGAWLGTSVGAGVGLGLGTGLGASVGSKTERKVWVCGVNRLFGTYGEELSVKRLSMI